MDVLFIGRFQPFHKGHINTILSLAKKADNTKIVIGSRQLSFAKRNPFTFEERKEMVEKSLKKENLKNFLIFGVEDKKSHKEWFNNLKNTVGYFDTCYTGNKLVKKILTENHEEVKTVPHFKRNQFSGTKIRKLIAQNKKVDIFLPPETLRVIQKIDGIERIKNIYKSEGKRTFTIGHSTRNVTDFIDIIKEYGIEEVVDIRTIPKSRHNPQFNSDSLKEILFKNKIRYKQIKELGGLRRTNKHSINTFWKNSSFRGFADYMQTADFKNGLKNLIELSDKNRTAIMCAEILPWNCHRSLVADALVSKGFSVTHIINHNETLEHKINKHAKEYKGCLVYK